MKKNYLLLIAIAIPLLMIIVIALGIFYPKKTFSPHYPFLYALAKKPNDYLCVERLKTKAHLVTYYQGKAPPLIDASECADFRLYLYDFKSQTSQQYKMSQVEKKFVFISTADGVSPDGFSIVQWKEGNDYSPFLGMTSESSSLYLTSGSYKEKLDIKYDSQASFQGIGWVREIRNKDIDHGKK